jgi:signal transduction histidine kinase
MKTFNIRYRSIDKLKVYLQKNEIKDSQNMLIQIFTSFKYKAKIEELISNLNLLFPSSKIIGCSSDGEILDSNILKNNTVISITIFEKTTIKLTALKSSKHSFDDGVKLSLDLVKDDTKAMILFASSKDLNAQTLLKGVETNSKGVVISGALTSSSSSGFLFSNDGIIDDGYVAISLSGDSLIANNYFRHDWEPISREFVVTKSSQNNLIMLDNKPIGEIYESYIGESIDKSLLDLSLQFPFISKKKGIYVTSSCKNVLDDGSFLLSSNIKEDERIHIAFANIQNVKDGIKTLFEEVSSSSVESIFVYSSTARVRFLKYLNSKEIDTLSQIAPSCGFYGGGEFYSNSKLSLFMSQTLGVLALSEIDKKCECSFKEKKAPRELDLDYKTIKTLTNIAQVSSRELEVLNKKLNYKIKDGIRENRKKESIMIHNSRLAQLGEMLGLIAHQWRQPLSAISATSTGMQVKLELDSWDMEYLISSLENIEKYTLHLSETIDDFTNFFKPTKRKVDTSVRDIIKKTLFIASPLLTKESVEVIKKYSSTNSVSTYPNEVIQVLLNLIKNSTNAFIKNKIQKPEIYINEYEENSSFIIEVSDNAGGIDDKIMSKIFDPYFSTKENERSMGLGLYMSKFIIEDSCGGTLEVENSELGAKFRITLNPQSI